MSTTILLTLAVLGILAVLGAVVMFMYLCAMAGGAVAGMAVGTNVREQAHPAEPSQELRQAQAQADAWEAFARQHSRSTR